MPSTLSAHRRMPRRNARPTPLSRPCELNTEPDWGKTIDGLMALAKRARENFEFERAIDYLHTLEELWESRGGPDFSPALRFELYQELGKAYALQGRLDDAIEEHQKILKLCRDGQHQDIKCDSFLQIGQLLCKQGDHDRALGYVQRAISVYRRTGDDVSLCKALRNLGVIHVELGDLEEADITYDAAIAIAERLDDRMLHADLINNAGAIMNMRGDRDGALEMYRKSLAIYEELNEIRKSAYTKNNIGIALTEDGRSDEALTYFEDANEIAGSIKDASLQLIVDINLADLWLKKGELDKAERHTASAERYLEASGLCNGHLVETKKQAGKIAFRRGDYETALQQFNVACDLSREIGAQYLEAEVLLERGILLKAMERSFDALADLEASYQIYSSVRADEKCDQTEAVIGSIERLSLEVFNAMAREVERKDEYTKGHSDRVASLALLLGKECGLRAHMLKTIVAAALLHDIGKISIDDAILKKQGRLTDEEFGRIKRHPELGVELLRGKEFPWDIKPIILHHHEKVDGTGYPMGLKGEEVPLGARILTVVDVFDALTSDRVYRAAYPVERALSIMNEESGTSFDPVILRCFCNLIRSGKADAVVNADTSRDSLFGIWQQCMVVERDVETIPDGDLCAV